MSGPARGISLPLSKVWTKLVRGGSSGLVDQYQPLERPPSVVPRCDPRCEGLRSKSMESWRCWRGGLRRSCVLDHDQVHCPTHKHFTATANTMECPCRCSIIRRMMRHLLLAVSSTRRLAERRRRRVSTSTTCHRSSRRREETQHDGDDGDDGPRGTVTALSMSS